MAKGNGCTANSMPSITLHTIYPSTIVEAMLPILQFRHADAITELCRLYNAQFDVLQLPCMEEQNLG